MVEAIRNSDRIHAISFGEFYLNAYGKVATRDEVREVFGKWNIDNGSSFISQSPKDYDPQILENLVLAVEALKDKISKQRMLNSREEILWAIKKYRVDIQGLNKPYIFTYDGELLQLVPKDKELFIYAMILEKAGVENDMIIQAIDKVV